ncbi:LPS translocon maturation chaperone LptM [Methyloligella solikamskensis]|uniref:Lipoprotein n=1 Tax=Methyloligella solikamskensis TaxID=1177756 RepID=A0ABW3J6H5_9HYPH
MGLKTMDSAWRLLVIVALLMSVGLSACGRKGSLERPPSPVPTTQADPETKMQKAPDRRLIIDGFLE